MVSVEHSHVYLGASQQRNERRTWAVIVLTLVTMVAEIVAGTVFGSMALVADGWHMSTHAAALLIAALAYLFARRHAHDPRYSFGTGRLGDLAAFASAVVLALVALQIGWESSQRLLAPVDIQYSQAILVAVLGLVVNLASAWLLHDDHDHHDHDHDHDEHHHHGHDNNLHAAYMHVIADALTSVLAIAALLLGRAWNWPWLDPLIGVVGALVIARWSWGLMAQSGAVLVGRLDAVGQDQPQAIRAALDNDRDHITDLHVWQVGPGHHAVIVALASASPQPPDFYKRKLRHLGWISHLTMEIQPLELDSPRPKS